MQEIDPGYFIHERLLRPARVGVSKGDQSATAPGANAAGLAIFRYTTRCGVVYGHTGNTLGYTQLAIGTADGSRSLTFSVNETLTQKTDPTLFATMRGIQEDRMRELLGHTPFEVLVGGTLGVVVGLLPF